MRFIATRDLYHLIVILLVRLTAWCGSTFLRELVVTGISAAAYRCNHEKRRVIQANLARAFGEQLTNSSRHEIAKRVFREFWRETFSLLPTRAQALALTRVNIKGREHVLKALEKGRGVILWESATFGGRLVAKQVLHGNGLAICQVHGNEHVGEFANDGRPDTWVRQRVIKPFFVRSELRFVDEIVWVPEASSLAFTRVLVNRLSQNAILCVPGDGSQGEKRIPVAFFGRTEFFATGMVSLAKIAGAPILPMFCIRDRDGELTVNVEGRPIRMEKDIGREWDMEAGVTQYVRLLESYIRRYPEQYRGWHHSPSLIGGQVQT